MIDTGNGPPLVLIPGLQGRWEWMRPTVNALARTFRVISFTLAGDWGSHVAFDPRSILKHQNKLPRISCLSVSMEQLGA